MEKKPSKVLSDHKKVRRKLIPPALAALGDKYSPYSWAKELAPEFLWIALLHDKYGLNEGQELATTLGRAATKHCTQEPKPMFARITSFLALLPDEEIRIKNDLGSENTAKIAEALATFNHVFPDHPLKFIFNARPFDVDHTKDERFNFLLSELYDRYSRTAALTMATSLFLGMDQGKILHADHLYEKRLEDLNTLSTIPIQRDLKRRRPHFAPPRPCS